MCALCAYPIGQRPLSCTMLLVYLDAVSVCCRMLLLACVWQSRAPSCQCGHWHQQRRRNPKGQLNWHAMLVGLTQFGACTGGNGILSSNSGSTGSLLGVPQRGLDAMGLRGFGWLCPVRPTNAHRPVWSRGRLTTLRLCLPGLPWLDCIPW